MKRARRISIYYLLAVGALAVGQSSAQVSKNGQAQGRLLVKGPATFNKQVTVKGKATFNNVEIIGKAKIVLPADSIIVGTVPGQIQNGEAQANSLRSKNLQETIDDELAVDLKGLLPGSTWTIKNVTADQTFANTTGRITFSLDGKTLTLESGYFASAGLVSGSESSFCLIPPEKLTINYSDEMFCISIGSVKTAHLIQKVLRMLRSLSLSRI